jgi:predicted metal-dependent phosphoesterase TrpH
MSMSNTERYVDLHLHSYYSDGTMSPEEIVRAAVANQVGLLAITDHNVMNANGELEELSRGYGIDYLSGVELDSINQGLDIHILGYGFDIGNDEFIRFVKHNRNILDDISVRLISDMEQDYQDISVADFRSFSYDRGKGGWKALHYFLKKGLTMSLREGFSIYNQYGITNDSGDYPPISEVIKHIHDAGGKAVLAHPGVSIKETDPELFRPRLLQLLELGFDGVECYYPTHSAVITDICLQLCRERGLLITAGSDCHGGFGYSEVGELKMRADQLVLGDLVSNLNSRKQS